MKPTTQAMCITLEKAIIALASILETPEEKDIKDPIQAQEVIKKARKQRGFTMDITK